MTPFSYARQAILWSNFTYHLMAPFYGMCVPGISLAIGLDHIGSICPGSCICSGCCWYSCTMQAGLQLDSLSA